MPYSSINSSRGSSKNPISKGISRPSSGVGVLLLDVIGNDVKSQSVKDMKPTQSVKLNPVDIIKALNPSFRPPSAPIAPQDLFLSATIDAPSKRSKSASALPVLPRKSRPSSRTSFHSSASVFIDDDTSGEGFSFYGYGGTASATPRSELSFPSRATSAVSRTTTSIANPHFTPYHTSREVHLEDMVDDAAIDSFLLDFKRKSRVPFAASAIQSWWRMARQKAAYNRYQIGRKSRCFGFKRHCFKAWHSISVAQTLCRSLYLNVSFRHWIKVVMDAKGWVNFCAEACNVLSQRPTGLPGPVLWNICIQPATWTASQDDDRALGDPLPVRALVVALQSLIFYSSKCISVTFRRWMKAYRWGYEQRAKGRLKLGHVLRIRFKEKFRLKFQMWARWAFFSRARRLRTALPVFAEHLPFWTAWIEMKKRKLMYAVPLEKSFWFRWMFLKFKKICSAKVSKSSKLSLVDQVFCISRMKNALNAWTKGMIVIRSETAFLLSRWKLFCLAVRIRKSRHKMKREVQRANCVAVTKRAFCKWANDVKNSLSYVVAANNSFRMSGSLPALSRAFFIWTEQRAHSILASVFMVWSQRARQRITWAIFLKMHAELSRRKLMLSVFLAWRQPAQASFLPISDAEVVAMHILSHRHDPARIHVAFGTQTFKAMWQQIADARNYTLARACQAMQTCPFENADRLCIQLTSTLWLQQIKPIIATKPSASGKAGSSSSSQVPYRNLIDVFNACSEVLGHSFVEQVMNQPRETFSKAQDVSDCNWGTSSLLAAAQKREYQQSAAALVWSDLSYLMSAMSNSRAHEASLRQHATKSEMSDAVREASLKMSFKSKQSGSDFVTRCLQLTGLRMWLSSVVGGWDSLSTLVPLTKNISAIWDLRLKERRALVLRDNLLIISGKVKDESSIFAALFKTKKVPKRKPKKTPSKKKLTSSQNAAASASGDESAGTAGSPNQKTQSTVFPQVQLSDSVIKLPDQQLTMIQRLTNMVHSSDDPISSFALSETVSEAMQPDADMFDQQLHNRYVSIANDADFKDASQQEYNSDSEDAPAELNGIDSDDEETVARVQVDYAPKFPIKRPVLIAELDPTDAVSEKTAVSLDASSSGPDFHISLAMKQYIAPKPIRIPRVALPVSLLAIARDLASQLHDKYENAKADLPSQILVAIAHKPAALPESDGSSDEDDDLQENGGEVAAPDSGAAEPNFISESSHEMVVSSDLGGVRVNQQFTAAPNVLFDIEGTLDIDKHDLKHLDRFRPRAPELAASFSALESKFVMPFSPQAGGKPFEHWDLHDRIDAPQSSDETPVLLAIPQAKTSKQPKSQSVKKQVTVFSPPAAALSSDAHTHVLSPNVVSDAKPKVAQELDFSLPDILDPVKTRLPNSNVTGAFPATTAPSKQNRQKALPDRLGELLTSINPPASKAHQPDGESPPSDTVAATDNASDAAAKAEHRDSRRQFSELAQKNYLKLKQMNIESSNTARALSQADEATIRRKQLLHEATESAYDALESMPPHLKVIFEENFDALINRVIDANTKNHSSSDHHHWHELNLQRIAESRNSSLAGLVADSDDHNKRVFQSRQHYRAMMAKNADHAAQHVVSKSEQESFQGKESTEKSRPNVELERLLTSNLSIKAPIEPPTTFTSGDREFVTGIAKPLSHLSMKNPLFNPSLNQPSAQAHTDFPHASQMQFSRSLSRAPLGLGTAMPFSSAPSIAVHSTPRMDALVQAPQFVVVDSRTLTSGAQLCIAGSEVPEPSFNDSAEAAFLKARHFRPASSNSGASALSNSGMANPAFRTDSDASKTVFHTAGLPVIGGKSLGIAASKKAALPKLESASSGGHPDKFAVSSGAAMSEQAAIGNVQGLVTAKSIFKAAPQQSSSRAISRVHSTAPSDQRVHSTFTRAASSAGSKPVVAAPAAALDSGIVLAPKALSSSQILGIDLMQQPSVADADAEVEYSLAASLDTVTASQSPCLSPQQSDSPVMMARTFSASHAVQQFNMFLNSLSIEDVVSKSQAPQAAAADRIAAAAADRIAAAAVQSTRPLEHAESVATDSVGLSKISAEQSDSKPAPSAPAIAVELQRRATQPVQAALEQALPAASRARVVVDVPASAFAHHVSQPTAAASLKPAAFVPIPSVAAAPSAALTFANLPIDSNPVSSHKNEVRSQYSAPSPVAPPSIESAVPAQSQAAALAADEPAATVEAAAHAMFDLHASAAPRADAPPPESSDASPAVSSRAEFPSDMLRPSRDSPVETESSSLSTASVPDAPQTTPQTSLPSSLSHPPQASPRKAAHAAGVKGSAIRSFLLTMQGNAPAQGSGSASSIETAIQQQRASAVELIRLRSALNPASKRTADGQAAAGISSSLAASTSVRRQSAPDRNDANDDESDEEVGTGRIFKNQKIKQLQAQMSSLSREFNALRSMYPPSEEIGERGNIAAGVHHFHDASSRITDRSADNSSVTNRLSAFISELDRKSPAGGVAFSFEQAHEGAAVADNAYSSQPAVRIAPRALAPKPISATASSHSADFNGRAGSENSRDKQEENEGAPVAKSGDGVTMKFLRAKPLDPTAAAAGSGKQVK